MTTRHNFYFILVVPLIHYSLLGGQKVSQVHLSSSLLSIISSPQALKWQRNPQPLNFTSLPCEVLQVRRPGWELKSGHCSHVGHQATVSRAEFQRRIHRVLWGQEDTSMSNTSQGFWNDSEGPSSISRMSPGSAFMMEP